MDDRDDVELGWIKITKVLAPDSEAGADIRIQHSNNLPMIDALGMLSAAQHQIWSEAD